MTKKKFAFLVLWGLICLLLIEGTVRLAYFVGDLDRPADPRFLLSSFRDKPWAQQYIDEFDRLHIGPKRFVPYVEWEGREFHGTVLNLDAEGKRKTWNPEPASDNSLESVFVFGGSSTWGTGVRDEYTMPSQLSKILNQDRARYVVSNYGQEGYSSTQELIKLTLLLKEGKRPNYVIFYDGYNNTMGSFLAGHAGGIVGEDDIRSKLEAPTFFELIGSTLKFAAKRYCKTAQAMRDVIRLFNPMFSRGNADYQKSYTDESLDALAKEIAADYDSTLDVLDALSAKYGFQYCAFWQPTFLTEAAAVGDEAQLKDIDVSLNFKSFAAIFPKVLQAVQLMPQRKRFHVIADALASRKEQVYIDAVHLSEEGNRMVAEAIVEKARSREGFLK